MDSRLHVIGNDEKWSLPRHFLSHCEEFALFRLCKSWLNIALRNLIHHARLQLPPAPEHEIIIIQLSGCTALVLLMPKTKSHY
jgi:hypothetical protein